MGSHGACIAGTGLLRQHLINFARPFIYTTAPSVHSVVSVDCAFDFLEKNIALQDTLRERIRWYQAFMSSGDQQKRTEAPIQTVIVPGNDNARRVARTLQSANFDVRPILAPTVPKGMERLRICLHTYNTAEQIAQLCAELKKLQQHQS
jgi:8-amino-7-oxononanoate synthase